MSDSAAANPAVPAQPSASRPEDGRRSATTASPLNDHAVPYSTRTAAGSSLYPPPKSPPFSSSLSSSTYKAAPSVFGSRTATVTATSPPTTVGAGLASVDGSGQQSSSLSTTTMSLNPNMPSRNSRLHVAEARTALVASMSNMLDSELQSRASLLHSNSAALSRQEQDVVKAAEALRKENDKLAKVAKDTGRKIKELGNVQNWAEVLERDFLVLEETVRLARYSSAESDEDGSCSECSGSYWSQSESERDGEVGGKRSGGGMPHSAGGHNDSVSAIQGHGGNYKEREQAAAKQKGKGIDGSAVGSRSSIVVEGASARPNASLVGSASNSPSSAGATTVSLDEAIMESLAEALTTDIRIGFPAEQSTAP
ncbi:hypothetical protein F4861DRAFT_199637 [Xylaria intraflava]|nr:hypothetical protein F4861DRAFT_199637 [Xylaria intraflava]